MRAPYVSSLIVSLRFGKIGFAAVETEAFRVPDMNVLHVRIFYTQIEAGAASSLHFCINRDSKCHHDGQAA
jgi:hypothetical protein